VSESENGGYDSDRQPWDQMKDETGHAYRAMLIYRDLGTARTLRRAAEVFYELPDLAPESTKVRQMKHWSSANKWRLRVNAWDIHLERIDEEERVQAARDMRRRHAAVATMALAKAAEKLRGLDADKLSARDAVTMMAEGVKVERLSRGQPDQIREVTGPGGAVLGLDDEMLEARIAALLEQDEDDDDDVGEPEEGDA
jgi:hypothetical protein